MMLPEVGPRIRGLFGSGFGYLAFLVATIYGMVRLIPAGHPYLNPQNIGRFGLRHVVSEAAENLTFSRKNSDQIIIFFTIILAIGLLFLQFFLLIFFLLAGAAQAGSAGGISSMFTGSIFNTPRPEKDIALNLLDRVFGVPGMFCNVNASGARGTCTEVSAANGGIPWPIHNALHDLFMFYSYAMLLVGVLIFLYFVVVVVMETATTGSPFGQRFQNVWVPIRLVVALGLLVPINYGLNTGQYVTLYAAKLGSGLATNGWLRFNQVLSSGMGAGANPSGESKSALVAIPQPPGISSVVQAMSIVHSCAYGEWLTSPNRVTDYPNSSVIYQPGGNFTLVKPYFVKNAENWMGNQDRYMLVGTGTTLQEALNFYANGDIIIRFGEHNEAYTSDLGNVKPVCGDIRIPVTDVQHLAQMGTVGGSVYVLNSFFEMVRDMWYSDGDMQAGSVRFGEIMLDFPNRIQRACSAGCGVTGLAACGGGPAPDCITVKPDARWKQALNDKYQIQLNTDIQRAWQLFVAYTEDVQITQEILDLGWGGSAVWYNTISNVNGSFLTSTINMPFTEKYPAIMETVRKLRGQLDSNYSGLTQFSPHLSLDNTKISVRNKLGDREAQMATLMDAVYQDWNEDASDMSDPQRTIMYNAFRDAMGMLLGLDGLLDIRKSNAHVHPLAQLTMIGKAMVESTIRNLAISSFSAFMGGFLAANKAPGAGLAEAIGGFFFSTAFLGLTAGVTLYYVVPFLPFIYFFFAVGAWVKSIFEAMVGVPLWALAHLRLDGEGLPGKAAESGYYLILEIGIRPILTVFGLIAALMIFTAEVRMLNFIWDLVTVNVGGYSDNPTFEFGAETEQNRVSFKRDVVDQFFYTAIYTIIIYMMATTAFKLIDLVPNKILRWIGSSAASFNDNSQNVADSLNQYFVTAGMIHGQKLTEGMKGASQGLGSLGGQGLSGLGRLVTGSRGGGGTPPAAGG